jgi:N-acetylglucosaminyldiphosphoundecaprenol N-acetyl-beta-D-mannosaminyltransferase
MKAVESCAPSSQESVSSFSVLGVRIEAVQIRDVIGCLETWIREKSKSRFVAVCNVHMVMEAHRDHRFMEILNSSGLTVPDGKPLTWLGRHSGFKLNRRVYGPDLFQDFFLVTRDRSYRHYFYGGHQDVTARMIERLRQRIPEIEVAGYYSPPYRTLTEEEDRRVVEQINQSHPDIVWVGLGCPKQEHWMYEHRDSLKAPVMVGVGQAFNIVAGTLKQAPTWMREHGLEWLFRLLLEPRRLWKRYLVYNTMFVYYVAIELLDFKPYSER